MSTVQEPQSSDFSNPQSVIRNPQSEGEVLVRVEGVGKKYCRDLKKSLWYGAKDVISELNPFGKSSTPRSSLHAAGTDLRPSEFWANKDISFELRRGECLGLIGRNGAGKTTLLKMLNGLTKPDVGRIEMRGHVGALIALNAGFNPILTGRENIYVKGSIHGLSKRQIDEKIDEIIDFAEINDFIDAPVQSYSSGMQVRLGFAVATALKPDVLILDEVLAVGDAAFRNKCYEKIGEMIKQTAVLLVTHNMAHVGRICNRTLVLSKGRSIFCGSSADGISIYDSVNENESEYSDAKVMMSESLTTGVVTFEVLQLERNGTLDLNVCVNSTMKISGCFFYIYFFDMSGSIVAQWSSKDDIEDVDIQTGINNFKYTIGPIQLRGGSYRLSVIMKDNTGIRNMLWTDRQHRLHIKNEFYTEGPYQIPTLRMS